MTDPEIQTGVVETPLDSVLGGLRQRRAKLQEQRAKEFPLPGYSGKLVAVFRAMGWKERARVEADAMKRAGDDLAKGGDVSDKLLDAEFRAQVEFLTKSCLELKVVVDKHASHLAHGFDPAKLLPVIEVEVETPEQALVALYPEPNDNLIGDLLATVKEWMDDVESQLDGDAGEAPAAAGV